MSIERRTPLSSCAMLGVSLALGLLWGGNVIAQATKISNATPDIAVDNDATLAEIVVTAQKRGENIQDVPITVTALSGTTLAAAGITNTEDLSQVVSGLNMQSEAGFAQPHLRGIGTIASAPGIENPVATYVDGVYYASAPGSVLDLNEVASVEVYKGPQGTLFGRNATGGVINITTRQPDPDPTMDVAVGYGNFDTTTIQAYFGGPLASTLSGNLAVDYLDQGDGFGRNLSTGTEAQQTHSLSVRAKLLWTPTSDDTVTLIVDRSQLDSTRFADLRPRPGTRPALDPTFAASPWDIDSNITPDSNTQQDGISLQISHDLHFARLLSITAYRDTRFATYFDADVTTVPALAVDVTSSSQQFTEELQLLSSSNGPFQWVAGAFFIDAHDFDISTISGLFAAPFSAIPATTTQKTRSPAEFGQASYAFDSGTKLTLGTRYTSEKRLFDGDTTFVGPVAVPPVPVNDEVSYSNVSSRVAVDQKITTNLLGYASFSQGFKTGGFNAFAPSQAPLQPEKLKAFEVGFKSTLLDQRLIANIAEFYYDYTNLQQADFLSGVEEFFNGPKAKIYGTDVDLAAKITPDLNVTTGFEYLHDKFTTFPNAPYIEPAPAGGGTLINIDGAGRPLPSTPGFTLNAGTHYKRLSPIGTFALDGNYSYSSGWYAPTSLTKTQGGYGLVNASLTWTSIDGHFALSLIGKNLTDKVYAAEDNPSLLADPWLAGPPRTYALVAKVHY